MVENVKEVIENAEVTITENPVGSEDSYSIVTLVAGGLGVLTGVAVAVSAGVGLYKLGKYARKRYAEHKALKEIDEQFKNGDSGESLKIDDLEEDTTE